MKRLLVYSHDTYGLGNIRRMLTICEHLISAVRELSILLVTGSPVIHTLRLPESLDYIKIPCLTRVARGHYTTKYLNTHIDDAIRLRSELIRTAVACFRPDLLVVDKKPLGVKGELAATLEYLRAERPGIRQVLVLRDILDSPEATTGNWERNGHFDAVRRYYDRVLVLGEREVFDPLTEYHFPATVAEKAVFCGYIGKQAAPHSREEMRSTLGIGADEKFVLVTPGGGQDGYEVIEKYLTGIRNAPPRHRCRSLIVCGPEMPGAQRTKLQRQAAADTHIFYEFTGEMLGLMAAADVVVAMGGYNTVCEILSLRKQAIIIPRVRPTEEQLIRADRMSRHGLFRMIHPDELTPERLMQQLTESLEATDCGNVSYHPDLNALSVVAEHVRELLQDESRPA
ncbi:MAG TPA: glycosyltransferase [Blastocatellia bacterium]|nr:glycosyltransferase [Blastocatellia bacterium]